MATATASKKSTNSKPANDGDMFANMGVENEVEVIRRGRSLSPDTQRIVDELQKCLADGTARSFQGVTEDSREEYARKIRSAGKHAGIEVSTRFNKATGKLTWGPKSVLDELAKARTDA